MTRRRKNIGVIDADAELERIRAHRQLCRRRRRRPTSRLQAHTAAMRALRAAGASYEDVRHWLETSQCVTVCESTVRRWLQRHGGENGKG